MDKVLYYKYSNSSHPLPSRSEEKADEVSDAGLMLSSDAEGTEPEKGCD